MRALAYVPFVAVLMGSNCDGDSPEPVDTAPPVNTIEVTHAGALTTVSSGQAAVTIEWDGQSALSFGGFTEDAGGLAEAWLTVSEVDFVAGSPSATGTGTSLSVSGTPSAPLSSPSSFVVEMHARAADGVQTDGPQVVVDVTDCVGTTLLNQDSPLCTPGKEGLFCELAADACYGEVVDSIANLGATSVQLFAEGGPNAPMFATSIQPGDTSYTWNGTSGLRGIGVSASQFELLVSWQ